jgi:dTDP-4-dehydrorhamnose reductase
VKLLVTGREGQVVTSLMERGALRSGIEIVAVGRPELDLLDAASVERTIAAIKPDVVVSAAAYTAVDQAEDEPEAAFAINERGAGAVAAAAALIGAPVIHLSTDYVFAGQGDQPYAEDDLTAPVSIYGKSKLAGEAAVAAANPRQIILRTAWVYSPFGKNFVKTMLHLARARPSDGGRGPMGQPDFGARYCRRRAGHCISPAGWPRSVRHIPHGRHGQHELGGFRAAYLCDQRAAGGPLPMSNRS